MKLNLGCGFKKLNGWINVDCMEACEPDQLVDLERLPWPWADSSVAAVELIHVLEHLGETKAIYLGIIKELYRVCRDGAEIHIRVPHPRHDHFLDDPTHVRPITIEGLQMFDQQLNREWMKKGFSNTPLGLYLNVDFAVTNWRLVPDQHWIAENPDTLRKRVLTENNIVSEIVVDMKVRKILERVSNDYMGTC